jgi:hypothetical protein
VLINLSLYLYILEEESNEPETNYTSHEMRHVVSSTLYKTMLSFTQDQLLDINICKD